MNISIDDFFSLRNKLSTIDVRSEREFQRGHIPTAYNVPILNNEERAAVGTDYKLKGQQEAIETGLHLVEPRLNDILSETKKIAEDNEFIVHCWRGGLRSVKFCEFADKVGLKTHQLEGGYKSYRQAAFESFNRPFQFILIGGCTGSGKTEILRALARQNEQVIDLEKLASHKGSVFGGLMESPQPTIEQFQNNLFEEILKLDINRRIWIEDESILIGNIFLPDTLWKTMTASPLVEISVDKPERVKRLVKEYGDADKNDFLRAMECIMKRLGGQRFKAAKESLQRGDMAATIEMLLVHYDKSYQRGLEKVKSRIAATVHWDGEDVNTFAGGLAAGKIYNHISN